MMAHSKEAEGAWSGNRRMEGVVSPEQDLSTIPVHIFAANIPLKYMGFFHSGERRKLVSAHVPSHSNCTVPDI
jgi:hypothetical protein